MKSTGLRALSRSQCHRLQPSAKRGSSMSQSLISFWHATILPPYTSSAYFSAVVRSSTDRLHAYHRRLPVLAHGGMPLERGDDVYGVERVRLIGGVVAAVGARVVHAARPTALLLAVADVEVRHGQVEQVHRLIQRDVGFHGGSYALNASRGSCSSLGFSAPRVLSCCKVMPAVCKYALQLPCIGFCFLPCRPSTMMPCSSRIRRHSSARSYDQHMLQTSSAMSGSSQSYLPLSTTAMQRSVALMASMLQVSLLIEPRFHPCAASRSRRTTPRACSSAAACGTCPASRGASRGIPGTARPACQRRMPRSGHRGCPPSAGWCGGPP